MFVEQLADQSMSRCPELKQHTHTLTILLSLSPSPKLGGAGSQEVHTGSYNQTCAILKDVQNGEYKMMPILNSTCIMPIKIRMLVSI